MRGSFIFEIDRKKHANIRKNFGFSSFICLGDCNGSESFISLKLFKNIFYFPVNSWTFQIPLHPSGSFNDHYSNQPSGGKIANTSIKGNLHQGTLYDGYDESINVDGPEVQREMTMSSADC